MAYSSTDESSDVSAVVLIAIADKVVDIILIDLGGTIIIDLSVDVAVLELLLWFEVHDLALSICVSDFQVDLRECCIAYLLVRYLTRFFSVVIEGLLFCLCL